MTSAAGSLDVHAAEHRGRQRSVVPPGHDDRRAGEQHPVVVGPGDRERAAGDVDAVRRSSAGGASTPSASGGRDHHRARAGAAGPGLAGAALVDPHRDVALAAADDELDVDPVRVDRRVVRAARRAASRRRRGVDEGRPRAGCPCRRGGPARTGRRPATSGLAEHLRRAHVGGDQVALDGQHLDAVAGGDRDREGRPAPRRRGAARRPGSRCRTSRRASRRLLR